MGQVIDFQACKRAKLQKQGVTQQIETLKRQINECEYALHTGRTVMERESAVIRGMELKMKLVDLQNQMGIAHHDR